MPPYYAPREQEFPEYEFLRRNLQRGTSGSRYNPAFEAMPQLVNMPQFVTPPVAPGEGKGPGTPAMPPIFMPGWAPPVGGGQGGSKPVTGEEAQIQAYSKGQGGIETRGPFFPMPPMVKPAGSIMWQGNQYGTSPGQIQTGPQVFNGPTPFGDMAPPPPPALGQFMAAHVPMMPPAYADVQMEARNNALQAAGRGRAVDAWTQAMGDYNRLNFNRNTQAADWMLRRDLGMGGLGLQERRLDQDASNAAFDQKMREMSQGLDRERFAFDRQKYEQGRSPAEQRRAMAATLFGAGKTGGEVRGTLDDWDQMFPATGPSTPPLPGDVPGSAKGGTGTPPAGPVGRGNVYAPFESEFDKLAAGVGKNSLTGSPMVGEFFSRLNSSKPAGFVQQNWPAIESYVRSKFGENAWKNATAPPQTIDLYDTLGIFPALGPVSRYAGGQLGLSPQVSLFGADNAPAWTWAGGISPLYKYLSGETAAPGFQPSEDAIGRSMVRNFLKSRGTGGK